MIRVDLKFSIPTDAGAPLWVQARAEFGSGDRVWLRAPSGFGKSSLIRVLAGVERPRFAGDSVLQAGGKDWTALDPASRKIGWVPQGENLFPGFSVRRQLEFPLKWRIKSVSEREARIKALIDRFELIGFLETPVEKLSGGEKARVAIARAMSSDAQLVLLDEPFAALDHQARERLEKVLVRNFSDSVAPVLIVASHDPPISQNFFTAVWQGTEKSEGSVRDFSVVAG